MDTHRISSIDTHGFENTHTHNDTSGSLSPTPASNNPYRTSMTEAIQEARRLSVQHETAAISPVSPIRAPSVVSGRDSAILENNDDEISLKADRPKTTFVVHEEDLSKKEEVIKEIMKKDMKIKFKIRCAKAFLRCLNFGCSLVVLSLVANSFSIFFATRNLPSRNNLPPWAPSSVLWPAYATLAIACISLATAVFVLFSYWRGGHRKAEKASIWFTAISVGGFFFMIILWAITAGIITNARNNSNGKDLWAWSCKDGTRKELFSSDIDYDLVCRQMDWSFVCSLIEIIVETLSILLYAAAFWRFAHKSKLRKSMDARDKVREQMYKEKLDAGDMTVYRPEFDVPVHEDGVDLAELGLNDIKNKFRSEKGQMNQNEQSQQEDSYYPAVPIPTYMGAQPIIDPNTGLPYQQTY